MPHSEAHPSDIPSASSEAHPSDTPSASSTHTPRRATPSHTEIGGGGGGALCIRKNIIMDIMESEGHSATSKKTQLKKEEKATLGCLETNMKQEGAVVYSILASQIVWQKCENPGGK